MSAEDDYRNFTRDELIDEIDSLKKQLYGPTQETEPECNGDGFIETSAEILSDFLDEIEAYVYIKNRQGRYLFVNRQMEKAFGISRDTLSDRIISDHDFFDESAVEELRQNDHAVMEAGRSLEFEELGKSNPQGPNKEVISKAFLCLKSPLKSKAGEIVGICGISHDITERKATEAQLCQAMQKLELANQFRDKLISIIAHDIRSPIGSLSALLNDSYASKEDITDSDFEDISHILKYSQALLEDLLTWAKGQSAAISVDQSPLSARELITKSIELNQFPAYQKQITLLNELDSDYYVIGEENMIIAVVRNLISNAIKFTPGGGAVRVNCRAIDDEVIFEVCDTGIGMEEATRKTLFDIRKNITLTCGTDGEPGSGIGLMLCKDFVQCCHGQIGVDSQPGAGSRFWFTLKATDAPNSSP